MYGPTMEGREEVLKDSDNESIIISIQHCECIDKLWLACVLFLLKTRGGRCLLLLQALHSMLMLANTQKAQYTHMQP